MAYSTLSDVLEQIEETRVIQLTDDEGVGVVNESRMTRAIADADEEIDAYVGSRYAVPITTVPAILRKLSVDIAIYNLYRRRDKMTDQRAQAYKDAIRFLEQVAAGKISLGASDPGGNPPDNADVDYEASDQVFSDDNLSGF